MVVPAEGSPTGAADARSRARTVAGRRRRSVPMLVAGVLVVGGCGLASVQLTARAGERVPVLAAARDLTVGQTIGTGDVRVVRVAADPEVRLVAAADRGQIVGHRAAVPVAAGDLLPASLTGMAREPAPGQSIVGLLVKNGQAPPGLERGARVRIVTGTEDGGSQPVTVTGEPGRNSGQPAMSGVVLSSRPASQETGEGAAIVTVGVASADAVTVARAASAGAVSIVEDGG